MLFDMQTITEFVVLLTRLTTEELADEQRMALIDQYIHLRGLEAAFQFDLHDMLMILITMLSTSFGWRGIVRIVGRIADSNRAQTLERHRSLHAVLFASRRVWLRVTKRALPGEAPARSIFKLVSQGGIPHVFKNRELEAALRLPLEEQRQLAEQLLAVTSLSNEASLAEESEWLTIVEGTRGTIKGIDRETIIWLAEDEELCGY